MLFARAVNNPQFAFGTLAGRYVALLFVRSAAGKAGGALYREILARRELFDDRTASFFVASRDPADEAEKRLVYSTPGLRGFYDTDGQIRRRFGAPAHPCLVLLDPRLRVLAWFGADDPGADPAALAAALADTLRAQPAPPSGPAEVQAPVLIVPRVFEPELCRALIAGHEAGPVGDSGYMKTIGGQIHGVVDYKTKRRSDWLVADPELRTACMERLVSRLLPQVGLAFRFRATRIERYVVACYDAEPGGYFRPHRDNNGDGHREFAVTLNLNAEDYEGGDLRFPEFGRQDYRPPTGGACVFACSLMHEATPVTRGRRYAFLPFLYDEAGARRREKNSRNYADPTKHYTMRALDEGAEAEDG